MSAVYLVKGFVQYESSDVLAVYGTQADAHVFMEQYSAQAEADWAAGDYDSEYTVYDFYEVCEMEVQ